MKQLIGIALALTLTLTVVPVLAQQNNSVTLTLDIAQNSGTRGEATAGGTTIVTPSTSTNPNSASAYAPGHGAMPPGQGGTPPGQATPEVEEDDDLDPAGTTLVAPTNLIGTGYMHHQ